MQEVKAFKLHG